MKSRWLIIVLLLMAVTVSAHAQQSQPQGPDETSMTLLGQCVYNNNANSIRAVTMQRQLMAMQEQEKATAEYWARWIGAVPPSVLPSGGSDKSNASQPQLGGRGEPEHEFRIPLEVTPVPKPEEKK
jgi:hypothetical protein